MYVIIYITSLIMQLKLKIYLYVYTYICSHDTFLGLKIIKKWVLRE